MDTILDILQAILPAILVFLTAWLLLDKYLGNLPIQQNAPKADHADAERLKLLLPLKLKAYERLIIFLERLNPPSIIMRVNQSGMSAIQLQLELLKTIREEYEHNQSLQIYVEPETWSQITHAKEEVITLIKIASSKLKQSDSGSGELARLILEIDAQLTENPVRKSIGILSREARKAMN